MMTILSLVIGIIGLLIGMLGIMFARATSLIYADYGRKLARWQVDVQETPTPQDRLRHPGRKNDLPMPPIPELRFCTWLFRWKL